jgi:arsenate reductase
MALAARHCTPAEGAIKPRSILNPRRDKNGTVAKAKLYQYPKCSTCRKAVKWLDGEKVAYESIDIVTSPPSAATLKRVQKLAGVVVAKLFNTSGVSYREGNYKAKLATMTDGEAFAALAADGKLIKRPIYLGDSVALVGFGEAAWSEKLG